MACIEGRKWSWTSLIFTILLTTITVALLLPIADGQSNETTTVANSTEVTTTASTDGSYSVMSDSTTAVDDHDLSHTTHGSEDGHSDNDTDDHGDGEGHQEHDEHGAGPLEVATINYEDVRGPLIFTIVVLLAALSKIGYHHADFLSSLIPESCILIILGTIFGAIFHFTSLDEHLPNFFEPHEFFIYLLPPIILEAAYSLHDRTVLENIGSIILFAVLGTVFASMFLGLTLYGLMEAGAMGSVQEVSFIQMMLFSSLIVAVDPVAVLAVFNEIGVNHVLYFLVFGESLLNDGVTVVLYKVFQSYNVMDEITALHIFLGFVKFLVVCLGGLFLGVAAGVASALLTKFCVHVKVAQPIIIFTMAYFGFLLAEMFEFSGIISIIGCGLTQVQYAFNNLSDKSRTTIKYFIKVISQCNEIIIFLFLGLSIVNDGHEWNTGFTIWTVILCLVYRFIIIFAMTAMINRFDSHRVRTVGLQEQFMIAYGGLRGAVCFSLVALLSPIDVPAKSMFMTTTLVVILFTVFVQVATGGLWDLPKAQGQFLVPTATGTSHPSGQPGAGITIKPLVSLLQIKLAPEKTRSMYQELSSHVTDHMMAGLEEIIGDHGKNYLREKLSQLDCKYLKPWLEVDPDPKDVTLKTFYENLLLKEHYTYLKISGAKTPENMPELLAGLSASHHMNFIKPKPKKKVEEPSEGVLRLLSPNLNTDMMMGILTSGSTSVTQPLLSPGGGDWDERRGASVSKRPNIVISDSETAEVSRRRKSSVGRKGSGAIDAMGLRSLLMSNRNSKMEEDESGKLPPIAPPPRIIAKYDRNLTTNRQDNVQSEIQRRKTIRNRGLQRLFSEAGSQLSTPDVSCKRGSWSDADCQAATERNRHHEAPRHANTVDLGMAGVSRLGTVEPFSSPGALSAQLDAVFEEDETPMLSSSEARNNNKGHKAGKYEVPADAEGHDGGDGDLKRSKSQLKRQEGMDSATPVAEKKQPPSAGEGHHHGSQHGKLVKQDGIEGQDMPMTEVKGNGERPGGGTDSDSKV